VVAGGGMVATIMPVAAKDRAEATVPTSMRLAGHTLVVDVEHRTGSYLYPIEVDPEINDSQLATTTAGKRSNWQFATSNSSRFNGKAVYEGPGKEHLETKGTAEYAATEWAFWGYETKGNSKIYELKAKTSAKNKGSKIESFLEFEAPGGTEKPKKLLSTELSEPEYSEKATTICAWNASKVEECLPAAGKEKNAVHFQQSATASPGGSFGFLDTMSEGIVSISEPTGTHSTTSYNTTSPELEFTIEEKLVKRKNGLYGSSNWLSNVGGALQMNSADPGIGVAATRLEYESSPGVWTELSKHEYLEKENACQGVQCYASHGEYWTLDPKLPDGEQKIRYGAEEAIAGTKSLESEGQATVKVDATKPHGLYIAGLPYGNELSEKPYELTGLATDGEGTIVPSSGVKSLTLYVDGTQFGATGGSCGVAQGQCEASYKWTINGAELGAGHHAIVLVAFDNAGNEARKEWSLSIRHSTPVALGPGSVDLQSGDYAMSATDVSRGSGLSVNRAYSSRDLAQGQNGPFGPEWSVGLTSTESLVEMVDGGVLLRDTSGGQSIFAPLGEGKFESPNGDANLVLTLEEKEAKKVAYYLKDENKHTSVKFTQAVAGASWLPTEQEGTTATDTVTFKYQTSELYTEYTLPSESRPHGMVTGPDGNVWFTEWGTNKIAKMTSAGAITEYAAGVTAPEDIIVGPDNNLWFSGGGKLSSITSHGGVKNYVSKTGSFLANGADGRIWSGNYSGNKIVAAKPASGSVETIEYTAPTGSKPDYVAAGPDGNLWYTFNGTDKVAKVATSGVILKEYALPAGSKPASIIKGPDGNIWYWQNGTKKFGKMSTAGAVLAEYTPSAGVESGKMIAGPDGNIWFVDSLVEKHTLNRITTSGAITQFTLPSISPATLTVGPEHSIWYGGEFPSKIGVAPSSGYSVEPSEVVAPKPAGVSCSPEMKAGCRALKFVYATSTTATGENSSQWGEYRSRIKKVLMDAYDPITKKMVETAVSEYSYDSLGRLRAEWDPRISPALKTTYGYDAEGHITALDQPGQEPWAFLYGTIASDAGTGRLLKASRAATSEGLWGGEMPSNTEAPLLLTKAEPGTLASVWKDKWSGAPFTYSYQWLRCDSKGEDCTPILGANNGDYLVTLADRGHKLMAVVTATNGGGSRSKATALSEVVVVKKLTEFELPTGSHPFGITSGPEGNVWFTDAGTGKVTEMSIESGPLSAPKTEYAVENFEPMGIATGSEKNLWFVQHTVRNVVRMTPSGSVATYKLVKAGASSVGIVNGPDGNLWIAASGTNAIAVMNIKGEVLHEYALASGSKPYGIAVGPDGNLWFAENGTDKVGKITTAGAISEYALPAGAKPYWIAAGPDGNMWFTDNGTSKVGKISTGGTGLTEYALAAGSQPRGIASGPESKLYVAEYGTSKVATVTTGGTVTDSFFPTGSQPTGITMGSDGYLWVTEYGTNAIMRYNPTGGEERSAGEGFTVSPRAGFTIEYGVPLSGSGLPNMTASEVAKWGQEDVPVEGTAIFRPDEPQRWPASNYSHARVYYLDAEGHTVNTSSPSNATYGSVTTTEYNEVNDVVRTLSADNRQKALEGGSESVNVAKLGSTYFTYKEECSKPSENKEEAEGYAAGARLCETEGPQHTIKYIEGSEHKEALARLHTKYFYDEKAPAGESYNLKTKETTLAELANEEEREVRKTVFSYSGQSNLGWKLRAPTSVTVDPEGKKLTTTTIYNATTGQVTEVRPPLGSSGTSAHDKKFIYYSAEANTEGYPSCGSRPEWAGLICETLPAKQPEAGTPAVPVTTTTAYNMWNEPETVVETFGATTRTKKFTYDSAERVSTSETTSTANVALPKVTNEYNTQNGLLEKQSTTVEAKTQTITTKYNTFGQLTEYTDADGNTAKYVYGAQANDWLLEEVTNGSAEGTGRQVYSYNATTKQLEKLLDSAAGTFTATYDAEGKIATEVYPNAMCAKTSYDATGQATHVEYIKTSNCAESGAPVWFNETMVPSVRGEVYDRSSTLAGESYFYDSVGRLAETQETPAGTGCNVRLYAYDDESNRTSQTTRAPGVGGKCATEGGSVLTHSYDEANRLKDAGVTYDVFGNVTKMPAADAEGHELTSTFYVDNAIATQTQSGVTNNYYLDPDGRVRETVTGATKIVSHYDGSGEAVAWTSEGTGKGTRNIPGIDGSLSATQTNAEAPVLQLHDLQGNTVATASISTEATSLLSSYNSTEFGVPNAEKAPPKYAWLGAGDVASTFSTGVITYGSTSYVPQVGRGLQSEVVAPPGLPGGSGAGAAYVFQMEAWNMQGAGREGAEAPGLEAAREQAAEEAALDAAYAAGPEDPTLYFLQKAAVAKGKKLKALKEWGEIWDAISTILELPEPAKAVISWVVSHLTLGTALDWLGDTGDKLEKCGKNTEKWVSECKLKYETILGGLFVNFFSTAHVERCGTYVYYEEHIAKEAFTCV
jgi:YD repeat-containing protein